MTDVSVPSTPAEASARLETLKADAGWKDQFLAGNGPQVAEFKSLTELAAKATDTDKALAGRLQDGPVQSSSHMVQIGVANTLREIGIRDEIIKDVLTGEHKVTRAEYEMTERWKAERMRDKEWVQRYLTNDGDAHEKMTLANIILSGGIREEKAV
jgi:hypothetical protein